MSEIKELNPIILEDVEYEPLPEETLTQYLQRRRAKIEEIARQYTRADRIEYTVAMLISLEDLRPKKDNKYLDWFFTDEEVDDQLLAKLDTSHLAAYYILFVQGVPEEEISGARAMHARLEAEFLAMGILREDIRQKVSDQKRKDAFNTLLAMLPKGEDDDADEESEDDDEDSNKFNLN